MDVMKRKQQLEARKAELEKRLFALDAELDSHQSKDWEELATEREGDEVLEQMGLAGQTELALIDSALARISSGEYGYCSNCGADIDQARLDVLPYTPLCKVCAQNASKHAKH